jgi:D-proline reductase (dithiol) PrdB
MDITQSVNMPRSVFVNYPLGHPSGKPFNLPDQVNIVRSALSLLETATVGGTIHTLSNSYEDIEPGWEEKAYS